MKLVTVILINLIRSLLFDYKKTTHMTLKKFKRIRYISCKKNDFFIFGKDNKRVLRDILKDKDFFYYDIYEEGIYFNLTLIILMLSYLMQTKSIISSYYIALVKIKTRKKCVTLIDNSIHYWRIAKALENQVYTLAIQNGTRLDINLLSDARKKEIFHQDYICFGEFEKVFFNEIGAQVKNFYPYGSIYEKYSKLSETYDIGTKNEFDICIISENFSGYDNQYPGVENAVGMIAKYIVKFAKKNNLKVVLALKHPVSMKTKNKKELDFYKKYIDISNISINYKESANPWASYKVASNSFVTVGMCSSLLIEIASRGKRIMACDFYGPPWSLQLPSPLAHINLSRDYNLFSKSLKNIFNSTEQQYWNRRSGQIDYRIGSNSLDEIKQLILK